MNHLQSTKYPIKAYKYKMHIRLKLIPSHYTVSNVFFPHQAKVLSLKAYRLSELNFLYIIFDVLY